MHSLNTIFAHYQSTNDEHAFTELMNHLTPLVTSIARKYCASQADVDDVIQESFIKLAHHALSINTNLKAWVATTTRNIAISYNRKGQSHRQRIQKLAAMPEHNIAWDALYNRLDLALEQLTEDDRSLILSHYLKHQTLKEIAIKRSCSASTISRKLSAASKHLRNIFHSLNLYTFDEICNDELFTKAILNYIPAPTYKTAESSYLLPTINIGVYVSQQSLITTIGYNNLGHIYVSAWFQLFNATFLQNHPNIRIIGLIEPGSIESPQIEATLREREYTGGYMDITNIQDLKTLDVIYLGTNHATTNTVLDSVYQAVSSGVGLFSEICVGRRIPGQDSRRVQRLGLMAKYLGYHRASPDGIKCCQPCPATIIKPHPIIKGLKKGDSITAAGCGSLFIPTSDTQVIAEKDTLVQPTSGNTAPCPPMRMPALLTGNIHQGRVVLCNMTNISHFNEHPSIEGNFLNNAINWLAEPRIKQKQSLMTAS